MLCERCKVREATIKTRMISGRYGVEEYHLCTTCAKELGMDLSLLEDLSVLTDPDFSLEAFVSDLMNQFAPELCKGESGEKMRVVCPTCKMPLSEFMNNSRFGCPDCYGVFDLFISDSVKQLQGANAHKGKIPKMGYTKIDAKSMEEMQEILMEEEDPKQKRIRELSEELKKAIRDEEYEVAARCRDEIRALREEGADA